MDTLKQRHGSVPDCAALETLTLETIRENIEERFNETPPEIYTWVGFVLLSVNPYRAHTSIYDDKTKRRFLEGFHIPEKTPHIFAIGQDCYNRILKQETHQSVVITGESGAGKTEACRFLLNFLTFASINSESFLKKHSDEAHHPNTIEATLISAGTVLEAFGNAKTTNNDNSSRFGKLTGVSFDSSGRIKSAHLRTFLLAKSRVTKLIPGEQNFTIFNSLVRDWKSIPSLQGIQIGATSEYRYLDGTVGEAMIPDHLSLSHVEKGLEQIGMTESQRVEIWRTLVGLLELGNLKFRWNEDEEKTEIDDVQQLRLVCELLGIEDRKKFKDTLTEQTIHDQQRRLTIEKSYENRDSTAIFIYEKLFNFLVRTSNIALGHQPSGHQFLGHDHRRQIDILDIYGFEMGPINSFDQLCINYANECLQHMFTQKLVIREVELYHREGLRAWQCNIDSTYGIGNRAVIELFDGRSGAGSSMGIFQLLNDAANVPTGKCRDTSFFNSVIALQEKKFKQTIPSIRIPTSCFAVNHSMSPVIYTAANFVSQDRGAMTADLRQLLSENTSAFISELLTADVDDNSASSSPIDSVKRQKRITTSLSLSFAQSVRALTTELEQSNTSFVRCIKSNDRRLKYFFDKRIVESQLRYAGIPTVLHVMRSGYPCRVDIKRLIDRIPKQESLVDQKLDRIYERLTPRQLVQLMIGKPSAKTDWEVGLTKVFFRKGIEPLIDQLIVSPPSIEELKSRWGKCVNLRVRGVIRAVMWILSALRGVRRVQAAIRVQSVWKSMLAQREALERLNAIENIQMLMKRVTEKRKGAVRVIVCHMRVWRQLKQQKEEKEREIEEMRRKQEQQKEREEEMRRMQEQQKEREEEMRRKQEQQKEREEEMRRKQEQQKEREEEMRRKQEQEMRTMQEQQKEREEEMRRKQEQEMRTMQEQQKEREEEMRRKQEQQKEREEEMRRKQDEIRKKQIKEKEAEDRKQREETVEERKKQEEEQNQKVEKGEHLKEKQELVHHHKRELSTGYIWQPVIREMDGSVPSVSSTRTCSYEDERRRTGRTASRDNQTEKQREMSSSRKRSQSRGPSKREPYQTPYRDKDRNCRHPPPSSGKPPLPPSGKSIRHFPKPAQEQLNAPNRQEGHYVPNEVQNSLSTRPNQGEPTRYRSGSRRRSQSRKPSRDEGRERFSNSGNRTSSAPVKPRPGENTVIISYPDINRWHNGSAVTEQQCRNRTDSSRKFVGQIEQQNHQTSSARRSLSSAVNSRKQKNVTIGYQEKNVCMPGGIRPGKLQLPPFVASSIRDALNLDRRKYPQERTGRAAESGQNII